MGRKGAASGKGKRGPNRTAHAASYAVGLTQPVVRIGDTLRFRENPIVRALYDHGVRTGLGLNELVAGLAGEFPQRDWEQFYQLIGYSVAGYHELPRVSDDAARAASAAARKLMPGAGGCRDKGCDIHSGVPREKPHA